MKLAKALTALAAAALLLCAGRAVGSGGGGAPGRASPPSPSVVLTAQGPEEPGQSLGAQSGAGGKWSLPKDTPIPFSTCIEPGQTFLLAGHTLTVYGDLTVCGTLDLDGGKLILHKSQDKFHHPQADGSLIVDGGVLVMQNAADTVQVDGNVIADGADETGMLTEGTVRVGGAFLQLQDYSPCSYAESGSHITEFDGAQALMQFMSPAFSSVRNLKLGPGASFASGSGETDVPAEMMYMNAGGSPVTQAVTYKTTGGTFLSLSQALSSDTSITAPNLYYSGNQNGKKLTVNGNLVVPAGSAQSFSGDVSATNVFVEGALQLNDAARTVSSQGLFSVTGSLSVSAGSVVTKDFDAQGACTMTGGTLTVSGGFRQEETPGVPASKQSFRSEEGSSVVFDGASCSCAFDDPGDSYFSGVSLTPGAAFAPDAAVSVKRDLGSDVSIAAPLVYFTGNLKRNKLTVTGDLDIPAGFALDTGGGTLDVSGDVAVDGALDMADAGDLVRAGGDFLARGDTSAYDAGEIEVGGVFRQCGEANGGCADSFTGGAGLTVRLTAEQTQWGAVFDDPDSSWLGALAIAGHPAHPISPDTVISLRGTLAADLAVPAPSLLYVSGDLGGCRLRAGDVTVPAGRTLSVGAGRLDAAGSLDVKGILDMQDPSGSVVAGQTFTAEGPDSGGHLAQGFLALEGDFVQKDGASARSFSPGEAFKTLLVGGAGQAVKFDSPADPGSPFDPDTQGSWFGALYICNGSVSYESAHPSCSQCSTGIGLSGLAVSSGSAALTPQPPFGGDARSFEALLPEGETSVQLSSALNYPNQVVDTFVNGSALPGDTGTGSNTIAVDPDGAAAVTIDAASAAGEPYPGAGEPFAVTYALTVQPVNTKLSGVTFTNASFDAGVAFDPEDSSTLYTATVPLACGSFTLTPALMNPNASYQFSCGGSETSGASFSRSIAPGESAEVDVAVAAYGNDTSPAPQTRTYRFSLRRQTLAEGIGLSSGTLSPAFDPDVSAYTADVPAATYSVVVSPQKGDGCSNLSINGKPLDSLDLRPEAGCSAQAEIDMSDATGTYARSYTVTVNRAPLLSGVTVQADAGGSPVSCALQPSFSSAVHSYYAYVPANSGSVTVSATRETGCMGLLVNGQPDSCVLDVPPGGSADAVLAASAGDLPDQGETYTVSVRKPLLLGLTASAGTLGAPFDPDPAATTDITLPYAQPSLTLMPESNDAGTGEVTVAYLDEDAGGAEIAGPGANTFALAQGQTRHIGIRAACEGVEKVYHVAVYRELSDNADLYSLGAAAGWLTPAFSAGTADYTLLLPETASSAVLYPVVADADSSYKIDALADNTPATLNPPAGGEAEAAVVVTALRGNTKTYHVTARRSSMLSSFSASPVYSLYASLSPGGTDRLSFSYTLSMPAAVKIEVKKGSRWYAILSRSDPSPGVQGFVWDGKVSGRVLPAGSYCVRITPYFAGKAGTAMTVTVKILPRPSVSVTKLSPTTLKANGSNQLTLGFKWSRICDVRADIVTYSGYHFVCTLYSASCQAPRSQTLYWDGRDASGNLVPAGTYRVKIVCGGTTVYKTIKVKK